MLSVLEPKRCDSCGRVVLRKYGEIFDCDRFVCNRCLETEVNEQNIDKVVRSVIGLLNSVGFEDVIYDHFEYKLATRTEMLNLITLSGVRGVHTIDKCSISERGLSNVKETIYVLDHLTEIEFRATLAHEILHSWQTRNYLHERFTNDENSKKRVEGFAQMGTYLVYSDILHHKKSDYAEQHLQAELDWDDPYYGKAFKCIYQQFQSYPGSELQKWYYIIKCARQGKLNVE